MVCFLIVFVCVVLQWCWVVPLLFLGGGWCFFLVVGGRGGGRCVLLYVLLFGFLFLFVLFFPLKFGWQCLSLFSFFVGTVVSALSQPPT